MGMSKEAARFLLYLGATQWKIGVAAGIGAGLANPSTRSATWRGVKWGGRNVAKPIFGGYARAGANITKAGGRALSPFLTGYLIGSVAGTAISHIAFGDEGRDAATSLYAPGGADFVTEGLLSMPGNTKQILEYYF